MHQYLWLLTALLLALAGFYWSRGYQLRKRTLAQAEWENAKKAFNAWVERNPGVHPQCTQEGRTVNLNLYNASVSCCDAGIFSDKSEYLKMIDEVSDATCDTLIAGYEIP